MDDGMTRGPASGGFKLRQVEEIRDWVLGWSMDQSVQQKMDMRPCDKWGPPWVVMGLMGS